jgi:hypothetical protein
VVPPAAPGAIVPAAAVVVPPAVAVAGAIAPVAAAAAPLGPGVAGAMAAAMALAAPAMAPRKRPCNFGLQCDNEDCQFWHGFPCPNGGACPTRLFGCIRNHRGMAGPDVYTPPGSPVWSWKRHRRIVFTKTQAVYQDPIAVPNKETAMFCAANNFSAVVIGLNQNPHARGAAARIMAVRLMIAAVDRGKHMVIGFPFDFSRSTAILERYLQVMDRRVENSILAVPFDIDVVSDDYFKGNRQSVFRKMQRQFGDSIPSAIIFNDTYEGITPELLVDWFDTLEGIQRDGFAHDSVPEILLPLYRFLGPMGRVADQTFLEIRDDVVRVYVDDDQEAYEHATCRWVFESPCTEVDGKFLLRYKDYAIAGKHIFRFRLVDTAPNNRAPVLSNPGNSTTTFIRHPIIVEDKLPLRLRPWCPERLAKCVVAFDERWVLSEFYVPWESIIYGLVLNDYNLNSARNRFAHMALESDSYKSMARYFPTQAQDMLDETINAAIFASRRKNLRTLHRNIMREKNTLLREREISMKNLGDNTITYFSDALVVGAGLAIGLLAVRLFSRFNGVYWLSRAIGRLLRPGTIVANLLGTDVPPPDISIFDYLNTTQFAGEIASTILFAPVVENFAFNLIEDPIVRYFSSYAAHCFCNPAGPLAMWNAGQTPEVIMGSAVQFVVPSLVAIGPVGTHMAYNAVCLALNVIVRTNNAPMLDPASVGGKVFTAISAGLGLSWYIWSNYALISNVTRKFRSWMTGTALPGDEFVRIYNEEKYYEARSIYGSSELTIEQRLNAVRAHSTLYQSYAQEPASSLEMALGQLDMDIEQVQPEDLGFGQQPLIITNGALCAPQSGAFTTLHALLCRNMRKTPDATHPTRWAQYSSILANIIRIRSQVPLAAITLREWIDGRKPGFRTKDIKLMIQEVEDGARSIYTADIDGRDHCPPKRLKEIKTKGNKMFAKANEVLYPKFHDGYWAVKGRIIQSLPIQVQLETQPWINPATKAFKLAIEAPLPVRGIQFWLQYAGGMNGCDLTAWLVRARLLASQGVISIIAMGDDSLSIFDRGNGLEYLEVDYSHYDQSQKEPQTKCEMKILRALGVPNGIIELLMQVGLNKASFRGRGRNKKVSLSFSPAGIQRITGSPTTSLCNTINNLVGLVSVFCENDYSVAGFAKIGLIAKINLTTDLLDASFLRGVWWPYEDGTDRWGPKPSSVVKMGKVQTRVQKVRRLRELAYGQGCGMGDVSSNFPILGVFRRKLIALGSKFEKTNSEYNPDPDYGELVRRDVVLAWMGARYGVDVDEIERIEYVIENIVVLPWFVGAALFSDMARIDYA